MITSQFFFEDVQEALLSIFTKRFFQAEQNVRVKEQHIFDFFYNQKFIDLTNQRSGF